MLHAINVYLKQINKNNIFCTLVKTGVWTFHQTVIKTIFNFMTYKLQQIIYIQYTSMGVMYIHYSDIILIFVNSYYRGTNIKYTLYMCRRGCSAHQLSPRTKRRTVLCSDRCGHRDVYVHRRSGRHVLCLLLQLRGHVHHHDHIPCQSLSPAQ